MGIVIPEPTDPTQALPIPDITAGYASDLRAKLNAVKDAADAKAMLSQANVEQLHGALGFGELSGGTITAGTGLSVNVASLTAFVGAKVEYSGSQVVGGLEDDQLNYIFLRQDATWTIPAGGSSTPPTPADGHGEALLWGTATTVSGAVTAVSNAIRTTFAEAVRTNIGAAPGNTDGVILPVVTSDPAFCVVYAPSLDDPKLYRPEDQRWTRSAQPWDKFDQTIPCYEKGPS